MFELPYIELLSEASKTKLVRPQLLWLPVPAELAALELLPVNAPEPEALPAAAKVKGEKVPVIFGNPALILVPALCPLSAPCKTFPLKFGKLNVDYLFSFSFQSHIYSYSHFLASSIFIRDISSKKNLFYIRF